MITEVRTLFKNLRPTSGLLNLPLYDWKSIYTTNYDDLVEQAYRRRGKPLGIFSSNFDFGNVARSTETRLYKIHGTIDKDPAFGDASRMILTESDYNLAQEWREHLFQALGYDLAESDLVIIGSSLSDADIKPVISRALQLNAKAMIGGRISLLIYNRDEARADLYRGQGINVVFGGIDEFFAQMATKSPGPLFDYQPSDAVIENHPKLVPTVTDVKHQMETASPDVSRMFAGWPANYADVNAGLTFQRSVAESITTEAMGGISICLTVVGASGVGKTTAARQVLAALIKQGMSAWEHRVDLVLDPVEWVALARALDKAGRRGVLFVDDAHAHIREVNDLVDGLAHASLKSLVLVLASSRNHWKPRIKSPNIYKRGKLYILAKVDGPEIERLISLVDSNADLARLVETSFSGFSRTEKRRRLMDRCEADMFVCMRNIFASESFDNIILREFADLQEQYQDVYRLVAVLENAGVKVHRQLVIRLLGVPMTSMMAFLDNMTDIVSEYTIDAKRHIYGWQGRHPVISAIIAKYKFGDTEKLVRLYDQVIDTAMPSYDIEVRSLIELCNVHTGIPQLSSKKVQNRLLRKIVSLIPGARVPRHRLIRNLTDMGQFEQAQTEIRIFENDFRIDAPVTRLKIELMIARATESEGILTEDRLAILDQARALAVSGTDRHQNSGGVFAAYCKVGIAILRYSRERTVFDDAMTRLGKAAERLADPEMNSYIRHFERLEANILNEMGTDQMEAELLGELE